MATTKSFYRPHFMTSPIAVDFTLVPDSTIGSCQIYDALVNQYMPDYTLMPLTVRLSVALTDPDIGPLATPPSESTLLNRVSGQWFVVEDGGGRTPIDFTSGDFATVTGEKHALKICRNATPNGGAMVILFAGTYVDDLGRQCYAEATLRITCESETAPRPRISLNVPSTFEYNPLANRTKVFKVSACLIQGGRIMTTPHKFVWQFLQPGQTSWRPCNGTDPDCAEFTVSAATDILLMYLPMLVDGTRIRVRAAWERPDGTWSGAAAANSAVINGEEAAPEVEFTVVRKDYRKMRTDIGGIPMYLPEALSTVTPTVKIKGGTGLIDNDVAEAEMDITWKLGKATGTGSLTPSSVKTFTGLQATIPVASLMNPIYGGVISVEAQLKPPYGVAIDSNGNGYTDENGNYYITR